MRWVPSVLDGHDAGTGLGDLSEHRLSEVEMQLRRVAPPAVVVGECVVGRAEVGGRHDGGARQAAAAAGAPDLKARAAALPVVEQRSAERRRVGPVPRAEHVAVPTRSSCTHHTHITKIS
jgi:hypothetical protein